MLKWFSTHISIGACLITIFSLSVTAHSQRTLHDATNDLATQIAKRVKQEQKTKIAVIPFRELTGQPTTLPAYLSEELITALVNVSSLTLVERALLDKVMAELKLNESSAIDPATAKRVGKLLGADALVTGTITDLPSYLAVNCRLIDTQTGQIFAAAETRIFKDDDVKKVMGIPISSGDAGNAPSAVSGNSVRNSTIPDKHPLFLTESYRLSAESARKMGSYITLPVILESLADKPVRFYIYGCYLLDENGERWDQQGADSAGFIQDNVQLIPGTRVKSKFTFAAKGSHTGTRFTLICTDNQVPGTRKIVLSEIAAQ